MSIAVFRGPEHEIDLANGAFETDLTAWFGNKVPNIEGVKGARMPEFLLREEANLKAGIADRRRRIAEVIAWQAGEGRERSVSAMAADYEALYGEVTRRRRAWPDAQA